MICIKTRSSPASLPFRGQVTEQTTVKWSVWKENCVSDQSTLRPQQWWTAILCLFKSSFHLYTVSFIQVVFYFIFPGTTSSSWRERVLAWPSSSKTLRCWLLWWQVVGESLLWYRRVCVWLRWHQQQYGKYEIIFILAPTGLFHSTPELYFYG